MENTKLNQINGKGERGCTLCVCVTVNVFSQLSNDNDEPREGERVDENEAIWGKQLNGASANDGYIGTNDKLGPSSPSAKLRLSVSLEWKNCKICDVRSHLES